MRKLLKHVKKNVSIYRCSSEPFLFDISFIESNLTAVFINPIAVDIYQTDYQFYCEYQPFQWAPAANSSSYYRIIFGPRGYFNRDINVKNEFIRVTCNNEYIGMKFTDFQSFVLNIKNDYVMGNKSNYDRLNVIITGISSLSRLQFHQNMPRTSKFLEKLQAIEFIGYNKVRYKTYKNLLVMLTGLSDQKRENIDFHSLVWSYYQEKGYFTGKFLYLTL